MKTETVKGFKDYTGEEAQKRAEIQKIITESFEKYGFEPAETPVIEYEEFVKGKNERDEAVSDIFRLQDKGKRKLALRYEFTFQLRRIIANKKLPYKRYQIGAVFRDEPVQGNRGRQFISCDADIIGSSVKDDAEILSLAKDILDRLKIKNTIYVGNRKLLSAILDIFGLNDEIKRKNVILALDELDKKSIKEVRDKLPKDLKDYFTQLKSTLNLNDFDKLKEYYQGICKNKKIRYEDTLFAQGENEIKELKKFCGYYKIKFVFQPSLVRGLSYYDGNVFEIKSSIKETILGGGVYTFNGIKCVGFGVSIERLSAVSGIKPEKDRMLIVSLNEDRKAVELADKLRSKGENATMFYGKPTKALEYANSYNIGKVIFIGKEEVKKGKYKVKDMRTGKEDWKGM